MLLSQRHSFSFGALLFVLALVTTMLVAACGGSSSGSTSQAATAPATAPTATPTAAATTAASSNSAKVVQVKMVENNNKYSFVPASITVPKGAKVIWTNTSDAPHTVTSNSNAFTTSSSLMQNQTFSMVFNTAGTYDYHCSIHTYMKATITVTP
jgi:plastocyanin